MLKRTIILLLAVLLLYAVSDWTWFKGCARPVITPIRNWTERQLHKGRHRPEAKVDSIEVEAQDDVPAPGERRLSVSEFLVSSDNAPETFAPPEFGSPVSPRDGHEDAGRLGLLREQLSDLRIRGEKAHRSRLQRIESELRETEQELESLERTAATGDAATQKKMEVKRHLARQRFAQLQSMRDQLLGSKPR